MIRRNISFILALSAWVFSAHAQSAWQRPNVLITPAALQLAATAKPLTAKTNALSAGTASLQSTQVQALDAVDIPDDSTLPQIASLARGLLNDPLKIYQYVKANIAYEHYYGYKKGALMTLLDKSGNDYDQCALLVSLLKAAGFNPSYQDGICYLPYGDGTGNDFVSWLGLSPTPFPGMTYTQAWQSYGYTSDPFSGTTWTDIQKEQILMLATYSLNRGWPAGTIDASYAGYLGLEHIWVVVAVNGTTYQLDPSFKRMSSGASAFDVGTAMGYDRSALLTAAGGTAPNSYTVSAVSESNIATKLSALTTNLVAAIKASATPSMTVDNFLGRPVAIPETITELPASIPFAIIATNEGPVASIPASQAVTLTLTLAPGLSNQASTTIALASLSGARLSLTFSGNTATIMQDDTPILSTTLTTTTVDLQSVITYPPGSVSTISPLTQTATATYTNDSAHTNAYALVYDYSENGQHLHMRQKILDGYLAQAKALSGVTYDTNGHLVFSSISDSNLRRQCITETLNVIGLTWYYQTELVSHLIGDLQGVNNCSMDRFGCVAQEASYYIDVYQQLRAPFGNSGLAATAATVFQEEPYFWSSMEHGVIEQMQVSTSTTPAVSTVKVLAFADESTSTSKNKVYQVNAASLSAVKSLLVGYSTAFLTQLTTDVQTNGCTYLLPQNANYTSGTWSGYGYINSSPSQVAMKIGSGTPINGGYNTVNTVITDIPASYYQFTPSYLDSGSSFNIVPPSEPSFDLNTQWALDPVDMLSGAFTLQSTDLTAGQSDPRGLNLTRYYNSNWNAVNPAGLGLGWTHSYNMTATVRSAPDAGVGTTTPYDMAAMVVAVYAANDIYTSASTAQTWLTTALISRWGVDNLRNNAVSLILGNQSLQFIKQPSGVYQPPANCTLALTQNTSKQYVLTERLGKSYLFNATTGQIQSITDFDGKVMNFTYTVVGSSSLLTKVTDAYSRTLTFNYSGKRLTSVVDSTSPSRSVSYGSTDGQNLTSYTDATGEVWTMTYANNLITSTADPDGRTIITNTYDSENRVISQLNQGMADRQWNLYWNGSANIEQSPQGQNTTYFYDQRGRATGVQDGLGRLSTITYDGQDHVIQQTTPLGETTTTVYDANNNPVQITDPMGAVVKNTYDSLQRLTKTERIDATTDHVTQYIYNASNNSARPDAVIDPSNAQTQFTYFTTGAAIGQLQTVAKVSGDGNRITTFAYDSYGMPSGLDTPNPAGGTFHQSFIYSTRGDLTSATDSLGYTTTYAYNQNRQKLTSTGPGDGSDYPSATTTYGYDDSGNPSSFSDALGHATQTQYSTTGKVLSTTVGLGSGGGSAYTALTNTYDSRDWLISSTGPIAGQTTTTTYDDSGAVKTMTDPAGRTVTFGYDGDGRRTTTSDLADVGVPRVITNTYNARGQVVSTVDARGNTLQNTYDAWGDRLTLINRRGQTFAFGYQANGLPIAQQTPTGAVLHWAYNDRNLLAATTQPSGHATTYNYDAADRVSSTVDPVGTITTTYDADNNRLTVTEGSATLTRTYDPYGRVKTYTDAAGNVVSYHYYANGLLKTLTYPGTPARTVTYTYDNQNRLIQVSDWGSPARVTTFQWRADGLLQSITRPNGGTRTMVYDTVGQLINYQERDPAGNLLAYSHYNYDLGGRITSRLDLPAPAAPAPAPAAMTYDADNRVATYAGTPCTFDADGNMVTGPLPAGGFGSYVYDARNRLVSAGGTSYTYDAENNRISQTTGGQIARYVMDPDGGPLPRVLISQNPDGTQTFYVYGGGVLLYQEQIASGASVGIVTYYHFDQVGNTVALTSASGAVLERIEYSPYGGINRRLSAFDTPFLFSGAQGAMTDPNGLVCMRARYYQPRMGRFINADPTGFKGGMNWYAYAGGDPMLASDPTGYSKVSGGGSLGNNYTSVVGAGLSNSSIAPMMSIQDFIRMDSRLPTDTTEDLFWGALQTIVPNPFVYGAGHGDVPVSGGPTLGGLAGISYDPSSNSVSNFAIAPDFSIKIPARVPEVGGLEVAVGYEFSGEGNHTIIFLGRGTPLDSSNPHGDSIDAGVYLSPNAHSVGVYYGGTNGPKGAGGGLGWSLNPLLNAISNWIADHE